MNKIVQWIETIQATFGRLTQREQFIALGGMVAGLLAIFVMMVFILSNMIAKEERRLLTKTQQLMEVLSLQNEYKTRQAERADRLKMLSDSNVRLVGLVEESAQKAGVEIGQLRPEDGEPGPDHVIESRVDIRASGLSSDRLQDFLNRLESSPGIVIVRRLKMSHPYRKDTADLELTIATYKTKQ